MTVTTQTTGETQTAKLDANAAKVEPKTVASDMDKRRIFANATDAAAYLNQIATFADFATTPLAAPGLIPEGQENEGDFDPKVYTPDMAIMVSVLSKQGKAATAKTPAVPGTVKAIVVAPIPTLDGILASPSGKDWLTKIMYKELNHVAVRDLRDAADIATVIDKMPLTTDAYISSARDTGGGVLEAFNELYKGINDTLSKAVPVWSKARLVKGELKKCFESAGYANEFYPSLENRGEGKDSLFVVGLNLGVQVSKTKGFDPTIFERWLASRNAKVFTPGEEEDEEDLDIDSLASAMEAEAPAKAAEPVVTEAAPATAE